MALATVINPGRASPGCSPPCGAGPMLRLQDLNSVPIDPGDVEVVTDHGRALIADVLDDPAVAGQKVGGAGGEYQ